MKTLLYVPFVSQYSAPRDEDGLSRSCGMACVKKVVDFVYGDSESLTKYVEEGKMVRNAYIPGIGWNHTGLVAILRNHGIGAYNEEFKSILNDVETQQILPGPFQENHLERGIKKIAREVQHGRPVIVSAIKQWQEIDKPHNVVVLGVERNRENILGFYYHDPDDENIPGNNKFVDIDTFRKHWRRFAIFISE